MFAEITDSDGRRGIGETSGPDWRVVERQIRMVGAALAGMPVCNSDICSAALAGLENTCRRGASAVNQALWDLRAQIKGVSVASALGEPKWNAVRAYANINRGLTDRTPEAFGQRASKARAAGFSAFKIAPFDAVTPQNCDCVEGRELIDVALERVAAVRAAIASDDLLVDCHWRFDERTAASVMERLRFHNVCWVECPLIETRATLSSIAVLREHANRTGMKLAGADEVDDPDFFMDIVRSGAYDVVMPDIKYHGGLEQTLRLGRLAEEHGLACSLHNPTGPVAHTHSVHLSALLATDLYLEFPYQESALFTDIVCGYPALPKSGLATVPAAAGLGIQLNKETLARLACSGPAAADD